MPHVELGFAPRVRQLTWPRLLACRRLSAAQLSKLALLLDEEWAAELGNPVGYSWAELLRERSWEALVRTLLRPSPEGASCNGSQAATPPE